MSVILPSDKPRAALQAVKKGRVGLLLSETAEAAFFGSLLLELKLEADASVPTMATDGTHLIFNPDFVLKDLAQERLLRGVLIHEVLHNAYGHHARIGTRDKLLYNIACDLAINQLVEANGAKGGWALPPGALLPGREPFPSLPRDLHAEAYYALLEPMRQQAKEQGAAGAAIGQVVKGGSLRPCDKGEGAAPQGASPVGVEEMQQAWKEKVAAAAARASCRGDLPLGIKRFVDGLLKPKADWRRALQDFVGRRSHEDVSWLRPQRRHVHSGLYLPGPDGEKCGPIVVAVDTSGSIGDRQLAQFGAEVSSIAQTSGGRVDIVYHDSKVQHVQRYRASDGPLALEAKGGGGTSHVPVFDWAREEESRTGEEYSAIIGLTDMLSVFPKAPETPVLWCVYGNAAARAPFGSITHME